MPGTEDSPALAPEPKRAVLTRREKQFASFLLVLVVITGAGNLLSSYMENRSFQVKFTQGQEQQAAARESLQAQQAAAQKKASLAFQSELCSIFVPIAALKAPPGDPVTTPGRVYEQQLEAKLAKIAPALECK